MHLYICKLYSSELYLLFFLLFYVDCQMSYVRFWKRNQAAVIACDTMLIYVNYKAAKSVSLSFLFILCKVVIFVVISVWMFWYCRSSEWTCCQRRIRVFISEMASFKPTKIQIYPKLGEKVTEDTLYWKNYKVWKSSFRKSFAQCLKVYLSSFNWSTFLRSHSQFIHIRFDDILFFFLSACCAD